MRVVVLWPRSNDRTFVVVVVLITDVPIESPVEFDCQPGFWRLKTHRIRTDYRSGARHCWIGNPISLSVVIADPVGRIERHSIRQACRRLEVEVIQTHEVKSIAADASLRR